MSHCAFCQLEVGGEPRLLLTGSGGASGVSCSDTVACRLRVALGGLHEWNREERETLRRISDILSVLDRDERRVVLAKMVDLLLDR